MQSNPDLPTLTFDVGFGSLKVRTFDVSAICTKDIVPVNPPGSRLEISAAVAMIPNCTRVNPRRGHPFLFFLSAFFVCSMER